jgi:tripartite-type tricarboxylate transporter receptor subunit TctC
LKRRVAQCLRASAACAALSIGSAAVAQDAYPAKVIRIVAPTAAGAANDFVARLIAKGLSDKYGKQVVVENRPGAGTMIGSEIVAKAAPDGYTLLMGLSTLAINPATYRKVPYDALADFAPITQAVSLPNLLIVHPSLPARNVKELIALAKARPGELLYASAGVGTHPHLSMELFAAMANVRLVHVPYKSVTPAMTDLVAGHIAVSMQNALDSIPQVRAGRLRALGVSSRQRMPIAPDIPTISEAGLPGYESVQWYGLFARAGTPPSIIQKLHADAAAVLRQPENKSRLSGDGAEVIASTPEEFADLVKSETVKWAKVARTAKIEPQ